MNKEIGIKPHKKGNYWWKCNKCGHDLKYERDKKYCEFCGQYLGENWYK